MDFGYRIGVFAPAAANGDGASRKRRKIKRKILRAGQCPEKSPFSRETAMPARDGLRSHEERAPGTDGSVVGRFPTDCFRSARGPVARHSTTLIAAFSAAHAGSRRSVARARVGGPPPRPRPAVYREPAFARVIHALNPQKAERQSFAATRNEPYPEQTFFPIVRAIADGPRTNARGRPPSDIPDQATAYRRVPECFVRPAPRQSLLKDSSYLWVGQQSTPSPRKDCACVAFERLYIASRTTID